MEGLSSIKFIFYSLLTFQVLIILEPVQSSTQQSMNVPVYQHPDDVKNVAASLSKFSIDLYQVLKEKEGNMFFSPFSISAVLAMTYMGAKEKSEQELGRALHFPEDKSILQNAYSDLMKDYQTVHPEYELRTSNKIYVSDKQQILDVYKSSMINDFAGEVSGVNFDDSEPVRQHINSEVEKETNNKIKDLLPKGVLSSLTRLVLVNAIYFKGFWEHKFNAQKTKDSPFWIAADKQVMTPTMTLKKKFKFDDVPELDAKMLIMNYKGNRLSLTILLPNARDGLSKMEEKMANFDLSSLPKKTIYESTVIVQIPKFKLEQTFELNDSLQKMGVKDLFDENRANLSGISAADDLFVSKAIHKAFLEINEEGSEAAAATAVVMMVRSMPAPPIQFLAQHPFFFFIRDEFSQNVIFVGRFVNPN